jgi:hypothetical protein
MTFQQAVGALGPVGKVLGGIGGQVAETGLAINKSLNTVGQSGLVLGNNLGLYDKAVLGARMSLPEFEGQIKSNSRAIAGLGSSMDKGALAYLNTAKKIQETPLAAQLEATGMDSQEFGKILSTVALNSKMADMSRESVQRNLISSVVGLAVEMDNTARLTGISRQQQQENMEAIQKTTEMQLYKLTLDTESAKAVDLSIAQTQKYGKATSEAIAIYAMGGPMNDKETQTIVSLGPEMADAARRLSEIRGDSAADNAKRDAITKEMDAIAARKAANQEEKEVMQRLARTGDAQSKAMAESYLQQASVGAQYLKEEEAARRENITLEAYRAREAKKVEDDRIAAAKGKPGSEGDASLAATTANRVERFTKDAMAGAGTYFNKLNTELGETIKGVGALNKLLRPYTQEQAAVLPERAAKAGAASLGLKEDKVPETEKPKLGGRETGSFGAVGKLIEDFGAGTPMMLHGKEGVITENQLKNLLGGVASTLKVDLEKAKSQVPTTSTFEKLMNTFKPAEETPAIAPSIISTPDNEQGANNDLIMGIQDLNKRMERLIAAVEDGHDKSVRAIKSNGNLIA